MARKIVTLATKFTIDFGSTKEMQIIDQKTTNLDVHDDFPLGGGGEVVSPLSQDLHQVVGQISSSQVKTHDGVGQSVSCRSSGVKSVLNA